MLTTAGLVLEIVFACGVLLAGTACYVSTGKKRWWAYIVLITSLVGFLFIVSQAQPGRWRGVAIDQLANGRYVACGQVVSLTKSDGRLIVESAFCPPMRVGNMPGKLWHSTQQIVRTRVHHIGWLFHAEVYYLCNLTAVQNRCMKANWPSHKP